MLCYEVCAGLDLIVRLIVPPLTEMYGGWHSLAGNTVVSAWQICWVRFQLLKPKTCFNMLHSSAVHIVSNHQTKTVIFVVSVLQRCTSWHVNIDFELPRPDDLADRSWHT